jgi:hypothetical protein
MNVLFVATLIWMYTPTPYRFWSWVRSFSGAGHVLGRGASASAPPPAAAPRPVGLLVGTRTAKLLNLQYDSDDEGNSDFEDGNGDGDDGDDDSDDDDDNRSDYQSFTDEEDDDDNDDEVTNDDDDDNNNDDDDDEVNNTVVGLRAPVDRGFEESRRALSERWALASRQHAREHKRAVKKHVVHLR